MAELTYDAVIVGAGHNGLAAAIHLASKGWSVAVLEAAGSAGGSVRTEEVTVPGFRHDLAAMNLSMFAGSPFFAKYREDLVAAGLELVPATHCFASIFRDQSYLGVAADAAQTLAGLEAVSRNDARAWKAMLAEFAVEAPHLFALMGTPVPSLGAARKIWSAWRQIGTDRLLQLARMVVGTPRGFLGDHFESEQVRVMMAAWGLHLDFGPDTAGGALFPFLETMACQSYGMVIGKGGADTLIKAMVGVLKRQGGELLLDSRVERVEIGAGGGARGVRLADGRQIGALKAVIANLHPRILFGPLLRGEELPAGFGERVDRFRSGPGTMMIHVAMDAPLEWRAGPDLQRYAYVHLAPDMAMMSRVYSQAMDGQLPGEPALVVGQPTAVDQSRAPDGHHALWIQVRMVPATIRGDAKGEITSLHWHEVKEAYADRVFEVIAQYATNIHPATIARAVYSPIDLERMNENLVGGDSLGGSHHLDQNFLMRPFAGYSRYRTPIKSLYMCGASTWPGAGTGAGSGYILGKMLAGG